METNVKIPGIVLIVLGLAVALVPLWFTEQEPYGGALDAEVVFVDVVEEEYLDIAGFLAKFPYYADMDAEELARRLHAHFFSETPYETYRAAFLSTMPVSVDVSARQADPLGIRGDIESIRPTDVGARSVFAIDAINHGLVMVVHRRVAFRYVYALGMGVVLIAAGTGLLLRGRNRKPAV